MPAHGAVRWLPALAGALMFFSDPSSAGVTCRIHDADQVLRDRVREIDSRLYFVEPDGSRWELVTGIDDPDIRNPGSGAFHTAPAEMVDEAIAQITGDFGPVDFDVYILPYPRRNLLTSSAEDGSIILSPGVHPWSDEQVHALLAHEMGHVIHQVFLPDGDPAWQRYRELRGLTDETRFHEGAAHRDRPHEIFAEDFRVLFGGQRANYSGTYENFELEDPRSIPGLAEWFVGLTRVQSHVPEPAQTINPVATANPFRESTTIRFTVTPGMDNLSVEIVGIDGRLVRRMTPGPVSSGQAAITWDGRDDSGAPVAAGIYLALVRAGTSHSVLKLVRSR